jgi:hypothetical protein
MKKYFMFTVVTLVFVSCAPSHQTAVFPWYPVKTYTTCWYDSSDSKYSTPTDTLKLSLSRSDNDTLVMPPWFTQGQIFYFQVSGRQAISLQLSTLRQSLRTRPVLDTLNNGVYSLAIDTATLKQGRYFFQETIGDHKSGGQILFIR